MSEIITPTVVHVRNTIIIAKCVCCYAKWAVLNRVKTKTNLLVSISMNTSSWKPIHAQPTFQWISTPLGFHNRKDTRKWVHKYKLWEQKTDSELLPFLYLFVHEEDPSGGFFYLPPAQTQLSQKSNQYLSQLFQRPGQCSYLGNPMPFSVFIRVISISLSMQIGTWTRSFGNISQK